MEGPAQSAESLGEHGKGHRLVCTVDFVVVCCVLSVGVRCCGVQCGVLHTFGERL
jgi:hypothetical protein